MFECHITIDPLTAEEFLAVAESCQLFNFKIAKLPMQNRATGTVERSMYDTFMTGHAEVYNDLETRMIELCFALHQFGIKVRRYKIEAIITDSRIRDCFNIITSTHVKEPA